MVVRDSQPDFFSDQVSEARRFYFDLQPKVGRALVVTCGGVERCAPAYEISRATFPYFSVEYVAEGEGRLELNGRSCALSPGTVFSYGPGIPHGIRTDPVRPLRKYFVDFIGGEGKRLLEESATGVGGIMQTAPRNRIEDVFDDLIRTGLEETPLRPALCASLTKYLVLRISDSAIPLGSDAFAGFSTYQRCRRFMDENFLAVATLQEAADRCHVGTEYFCRLFDRFGHVSPYRYLVRLKMRHAAERLISSGRPVKQVAAEAGYPDPYHFSRVFKKIYGLSPRRFCELGKRRSVGDGDR